MSAVEFMQVAPVLIFTIWIWVASIRLGLYSARAYGESEQKPKQPKPAKLPVARVVRR